MKVFKYLNLVLNAFFLTKKKKKLTEKFLVKP